MISLKPRPNDRNVSTQHIATMLGATCCDRLVGALKTWFRERKISTLHVHVALFACAMHATKMKT